MGLGIHVRDLRREEIRSLTDSPDDSFRRMCQSAPWESLRRGVMQHGTTVFNSLQLYRFIEELEALPPAETTATVREVLDAAQLALRHSGYLEFVGD
ncbi:hypothetical protein ACIA98_05820 [Streptomyces sp. NPDC051366]|uniref:hypothetical protein n=1 Tax=Streptomyces sp. NPDC051366 TaxID=3365652 RepID=UPI0037AD8450